MGLEKISEYKKALGLTNEELAKLSGVPKGTLDKILSGITKDPKLGTLKALAKVLNCTLDDFDDNNFISKGNLSQEEIHLLDKYNKLNDLGKSEANKRVSELTEIYKYTNNCIKSDNGITTFAAHTDEDNPEFAKYDEEIAKKFMNKLKNKDNK